MKQKITELENKLSQETSLRNRDTVLRSADNYISNFGRALPYLLIGSWVLFFGFNKNNIFSIFWVSIPILQLILDFPRIYVSFRNLKRALVELTKFFPPHSIDKNSSESKITLDKNWEIWGGTIAENLLNENDFKEEILSALHLLPELGNTIEKVLAFKIETLGANLSEGQKKRLLLARALCLAWKQKKSLRIEISLSSIDVQNLSRLLTFLEKQKPFVTVEFEENIFQEITKMVRNKQRTEETNEISIDEKIPLNPPIPSRKSFLLELGGMMRFFGLLMIFPSMILAGLGFFAYQEVSSTNLFTLLCLSLAGCFLALLLGYLIERSIRYNALKRLNTGLENIKEASDSRDPLQIVSRDFQTINERLAWYSHDLAWIFSLLFTLISILIYTEGVFSFLVIIVFAPVYYLIWKTLVPYVIASRNDSILGINQLLESVQNLFCTHVFFKPPSFLGVNESNFLNTYRNKQVLMGIKAYFETHTKMISNKAVLSFYSTLLSGLFLFLLSASLFVFSVPPVFAVLLFTSFLSVDSEITRMFFALSGFKAQLVSQNRLIHFAEKKEGNSLFIDTSIQNKITLGSFKNILSGISFKSLDFTWGDCFSLTGNSGTGKTQYLRGLTNLTPILSLEELETKLFYLNQDFFSIIQWETSTTEAKLETPVSAEQILFEFIKRQAQEGQTVIILDETLTCFELNKAKKLAIEIENFCREKGSSLILVDHRFSLSKKTEIFSLLKN